MGSNVSGKMEGQNYTNVGLKREGSYIRVACVWRIGFIQEEEAGGGI